MDRSRGLKQRVLGRNYQAFYTLCVLMAFTGPALAQTAAIPQGITPGSTRIIAGPVNIDMATGNMVVDIPVRSKSGVMPFAFDLLDDMGNQGAINSYNNFLSGGVMPSMGMTGFNPPNPTDCGTPPNVAQLYGSGLPNQWSVSDGTGATHPFFISPGIRVGPNAGCGQLGPVTAVATDGSGYTAIVTGSNSGTGSLTSTVYNKDGVCIGSCGGSSGTWTDPDQNTISAAYGKPLVYTDSFGQIAMTYAYGGGNGASDKYYYTDGNGTTQYYTVAYTQQTVFTVFGCGAPYGDFTSPTPMYLPSSVSTPVGSYTFTYQSTGSQYGSDVTGRLLKVTLPTGGYVQFGYSGGTAGYNCTSRVIPTLAVTINDNNGKTNTTTYVNNNATNYQDPCCGNFNVTVTSNPDPDNGNAQNVTVNSFNGEWLTQSAAYEGPATGTPLSIVQTCYNGNTTTCATPPFTVGGQFGNLITKKNTFTVYNSSSLAGANEVITTYDCYTISPCYGNVTSVAKYDWNQVLLSTTNYAYGGCGAGAYVVDRPCSVTTLDPSNNTASQTLYTYNASGHQTKTQRWVSGTTYLTSSASFNSNGTIQTATDANTGVTTYGYDGSCNSLVPTSTTFPTVNSVTLKTSQTWDCNGGVVTSTTDSNTPANVTHYYYSDPLWRQTEIDYPDAGETKTTYNDTASPPNIQVNRLMDSASHWLTTQTNLDGVGRPIQKLLTSDPNGTVHTDTVYDVLGRVASVSNPYYTTSDTTYGLTQYTYDALGRATSVTNPDSSQRLISYSGAWSDFQDEGNGTSRVTKLYQHDGLGRLVTVCEVSSASQQGGGSPTSCGAFSLNGYLTGYTYSAIGNMTGVTQGSQSRSYNYDGLFRLTTETNPEASGGTTYTYDASGQQGDLYQRIAPAPNQTGSATITTTYSFDKLHRLTQKSYSDGVTLPALFGYDQTSITMHTTPFNLSNSAGRLSWECTATTTSCPSMDGFSYDAVGRVVFNPQCVPPCSVPFSLNYSYDYLGDWGTSTNGMGTTFTYAYNQAAELTSLTSSLNDANHPPTLFSLPSYNALGSLLNDNLGNGSETLTYFQRGQMKTVNTTGPDPGNNTPGKGSVAIAGTEQSIITTATGSVTIGGTEGSKLEYCHENVCVYLYDGGTVTVTIGGYADQVSYGETSTDSTIAAALVTAINNDSHDLVTASQSGTTIYLTSEVSGSGGNYSLSTSVTSNFPSDFNPPSFSATPSGSTLTGGSSIYDSGTVSATVGGREETVNYGQNDTPTTIATNLAAKFNGDSGSLVTASASGSTVDLTSKATGSGSNYSLSKSVTWNSGKFSNPSFSATPSGPDLTGGANGEGPIYSLTMGYAPNRNTLSANDSVNGSWSYGYDDFNRLTSASGPKSYTYAYDRFGNRWQENPGPQYSFTGNNNRIDSGSGVTYDAPGNMTKDGLGHSYYYDAENRLIQVDGTFGTCSGATACYTYDAEGRRVGKTLGAATVNYLFDLGGKPVAEVSSAGVWNRGEVYAGGRHLATYTGGASGATYFDTTDWQGTERVRTGISGPIVETCTNLPFGDGLTCTGSDVSPMHFTGQQRDTETNLDNFPARYYSSTEGRWASVDPAGMDAANPADPQSWNLYAYVMDSPVTLTDPSGLLGVGQQWGGLANMFCDTDTCPSFIVDGLRASATVALGLLRSGGGAICSQCGNPFNPISVGADGNEWHPGTSGTSDGGFVITKTIGGWGTVGAVSDFVISGLIFSQGKGERGDTAKPDKPRKGLKQDKDGRWWEWKGHEGKWVPKPPGYNPDTVKKIGIVGAIGAAGAYVVSTAPEWAPFLLLAP